MAQTFYQPNYATDRRFAPSGFTIPSGPSIEEQNRMANAPVQQAAPAKANPMDTLNKTLGLNLGDPYQNSAMKQATDAMPQSDQLANGLRQAGGTAGISRWSTIMQDTGGLPDPTRPDFQQRQQAGIALFNRLQQQGLMDSQPSGFMPPSRDAYMGGGDSVTGQQALAAGGAELSGYGGTRVSGTPGINGGPNRFMLRQNPDTIPAEGSFTPPSNPVQAGPSAYQQSLSRYDAALAAMSKPKDNAPSGYRANPDGSLSFIPGGPADPAMTAPRPSKPNLGTDQEIGPDGRARYIPGSEGEMKARDLADKAKLRQRNAADNARSVIRFIDAAIPDVGLLTAGLGAAVFSKLPGTDARDLAAKIDTVKANIGFDRLQQMRQESPTGGALGQVAVKELDFLQSVRGSLDNWQSPAELKKNLGLVRKSYERFMMANAGFDPDTEEGRKAFYAASGIQGDTGGNQSAQKGDSSIDNLIAKYAQ